MRIADKTFSSRIRIASRGRVSAPAFCAFPFIVIYRPITSPTAGSSQPDLSILTPLAQIGKFSE
ncbi:hypothetical protein [Pyramidobacter sp. C12-8]|uniref:hypothetical protein n=1 Tax=Pyramidobacter sp. C12-8 TaxID=1943580 RepID=UPI0014388EC4|nr:hypothetical protein [Pyramidobacter sp. C12-8]